MFTDKPIWKWSYEEGDDALRTSIGRFGILSPLWVVEKNGLLQIVDGYKRWSIAKDLGVEKPPYLVLDISLTEREVFERSFEQNLFRSMNLLDRAQMYVTLKNYDESLVDEKLSLLGFKDVFQAKKAARYLSLPRALVKIVFENSWADAALDKLSRFTEDELLFLQQTIFTWPLNQNKVFQILDYLHDISRRDNIVLETLFAEFSSSSFYQMENKTDSLREFLYTKRYPKFSGEQQAFKEKVVGLKLPRGMSVEPKDAFETGRVELKATFESLDEVKEFFKIKTSSRA